MNNQPHGQKATHYPSTHPAVMTVSFLLIPALLWYLLRRYGDGSIEPWQVWFVSALFWCGAAFYAVKWMHSARFTEEGILFYRLGREYRRISWADVTQVGLAKEYKASKLTLVITPSDCPRYEDHTQTTTAYVERCRKQLILLDGTKENQNAVQHFYGELSYNAKYPNSGVK